MITPVSQLLKLFCRIAAENSFLKLNKNSRPNSVNMAPSHISTYKFCHIWHKSFLPLLNKEKCGKENLQFCLRYFLCVSFFMFCLSFFSQPAFATSKLIMETPGQHVRYED